ncbi:branched-chain amino acid ABC transporter permease [Pseudoroseomonas cervicalis]|uniref:branched-chain amino acid ABC transporter permease n=1 Tax=Teichococcus cervicalis TaxID=204525 RepID=UPI0027883299|nr:branched-chain amino acid ABC transporter permease [Pseudoroseomonas cervicalis]MDQ1079742.1 neutral amino acid transport system permease protein [Pseudoroseomonas cervicalis]
MLDAIPLINAVINGVVVGLLLALPALAITMVYGIGRFANAATGDYMTFGAYAAVASQFVLGGSLLLSGLVAMLATAAVSLFFYAWVFRALARRSHVECLIASVGVAFALRSSITFFVGQGQFHIETPLVRAWNFNGIRILPTDVWIVATALAALALVFLLLHATPMGRRMRAVADDPDLARVSGISRRQVMLLLWTLVGAFSGLGGLLLGIKAVVIPELGWELLLPMFASVILGGIGNPLGAVAGMLIFGISQEVANHFVGPAYKIVLAFLVLLLVLLLRPQGLLGARSAVR